MTFHNIDCGPGEFMREVTHETKRRATTVDASKHADNIQWAIDKLKAQARDIALLREMHGLQSELMALQRDEINALKADVVRLTVEASK